MGLMRFLLAWSVISALLPGVALAKRSAPTMVEPVVNQGVRYTAPNDDGRRGYILAWDAQTNKKLWDLTVFTNRISSNLEEDVQWIFIKALKIRDKALIVTSEDDQAFRVDLDTKAVTRIHRPKAQKSTAVLPVGRYSL
jgi:hypothetical protein